MPLKQYLVRIVTLLLIVLVVASCAPRAGGGSTMDVPGASELSVDLPALVLDFDLLGKPSLGDVPVVLLAEQLALDGADQLNVPPDVVRYLVDSNIQHLQLSNSPGGLILLVNGQAMPSLKWDGGELQNTAQVIDLFGVNLGAGVAVLESLLPVVSQLGVGVVARFPVPIDVAEIPLQVEGGIEADVASQQMQEQFLAAVENPPAITVPVYYDSQGSWRVGDLTYAEWISLTGMPVFDSFRLKPDVVDRLIRQGISEFTIASDVDGIHVGINGQELPYIGWADGELSNAFDLARHVGLLNSLSEQNVAAQDFVAMVEALLPVVQTTKITITAHFPEALAVIPSN